MTTIWQSVADHIRLLASPKEQLDYESCVPIANVPAKLVSGFCDDLYHPKSSKVIAAFSESELIDLSYFCSLLLEAASLEVSSVLEMLKEPAWRRVVSVAKELMASRSWDPPNTC